jgi:hypothetical protein
VLLEKVVLQSGVRLVIVQMGDGVEAELDELLAEGGDCVVSRTPFALKRDSGRIDRPKRRPSDAPLVVRCCHRRVKKLGVETDQECCVYSK